MLQLPLVLFIVMVEVSVGAVSVLVLLDWRNEVKRGFLISYALIYLVLVGLTYLFQQNFATSALLNTYPQLDKAWTGQEALPLLLFFLLLLPYSFFLLLDKHAGVAGKDNGVESEDEAVEHKHHSSTLRILRLASGGATVVAGLVALFVLAMIFHALVAGAFGGAITIASTIASFFAAAFALGGVMTAMWLGHWYLVTPALSERPLLFSTTVVLVAVLAQGLFSLAAGPSVLFGNQATPSSHPATVVIPTPTSANSSEIKPLGAPQMVPLSSDAIGWIHLLVGFVMPLVLSALAWKLIRDRSFQSATGMLYLVVVCALAGEAMARGLFLGHL
jgi:DMSO reductase anchor subunit